MSTLDLEEGDEARADELSERQKRRRARRTEAANGDAKPSKPASEKREDDGLRGRIERAFTRVAEQLEAREDIELATAIQEEKQPMATGLVSLTGRVKVLRGPLTLLVDLLEPVLAFGRVGRILFVRFLERRQRQYEAAQAEAEAVPNAVG